MRAFLAALNLCLHNCRVGKGVYPAGRVLTYVSNV